MILILMEEVENSKLSLSRFFCLMPFSLVPVLTRVSGIFFKFPGYHVELLHDTSIT